jgi:hypothetical protein
MLQSVYDDIKNYLPAVAAVGGGLLIIGLITYFIFK